MESYKNWKVLNESLYSLGVANPANLGINMGQFDSVSDLFEKKKDIEVEVGDDESDDLGDEEGVKECGCNKSGKKSAKKSAKKSGKKSAKKSAKNMDSDMGGDFEDDDGEDHHDKEHEEDHDDEEHEEEEDHDDEGGEGEEDTDAAGGGEAPMFSKSEKKSAKKMHKESTAPKEWWKSSEEEWTKSLQSMLGPKANFKNRDGWSEYQEDALLPAVDPNAGVTVQQQPAPGEPGFAPAGRLDVGFDSNMSLGEAVKVIEEAVEKAGPKLQAKLIKKLAQLHNKLITD